MCFFQAINTCKNLSGIEMHFINETEFGLKIIVAKLKRMKSPYITAIQNVVKISEVPVSVPSTVDVPVNVDVSELERFPEVGVYDSSCERGAGDTAVISEFRLNCLLLL